MWCVAAALALLGALVLAASGSATRAQRVTIRGSVPSYATEANLAGPASGKVDFAVVLRWQDESGLKQLDQAVSDPSSPDYGNYLSPDEFRARFAPSDNQVAAVESWLRESGFEVSGVSTSRMLVYASGSVTQANRAFDTTLKRYRVAGQTVQAAATPVSVPADLGAEVVAVDGLDQDFAKPLARTAPPPPAFRNAKPCSRFWAEKVATNKPKAYGEHQPWAPCGYRPNQLQGAYGVDNAIDRGTDGSGQTVAITDAFKAPTVRRDANRYSHRHGLPPVDLTQKRINGRCRTACGTGVQQGWYGEETLDVEAVHSMAPGAHVLFVAAPDPALGLTKALAWIVDNGKAQIVTNSWGSVHGEQWSHSRIRTHEQIFREAVAEGIGMYFSSGDEGDSKKLLGYATPIYPSSSANVISVGGTSLAVGPEDRYRFEVGWGTHKTYQNGAVWQPDPPGPFLYGAGGGTSRIFPEPGYQQGVVPGKLARRYAGTGRVDPDVGLDGDPSTGMLVGETQTFPNGKRHYDEYRLGGTSLSSPLMAGIMALADQRAGFHHGFVDPALYRLAGTNAFRDVRSSPGKVAMVRNDFNNGVNNNAGRTASLRTTDRDTSLHTHSGYDDVTGLGSPHGAAFLRALSR